ncbi:MAG: TonB family protein [Candidatus Baltobacteraceae bacterium]
MADKNDSPYITMGHRARSFLWPAVLISLLIHLVGGPLIPFKQTHAEDQTVEKVSEIKKVVVKVPTPPPPTPTPNPTQPPKSTPPPKQQQPQPRPLKVNLIRTHNSSNTGPAVVAPAQPKNGSDIGVPQGQGTAAPAPVRSAPPAPTPAARCAVPYRDAVATNKVPPDYPEMAREQNLGVVTVLVKVTVGASGSLTNATVQQSSGNSSIDNAAVAAARASSYSPKIVNCLPVAGDYGFTAEFDPGN